MRFIFHFKISTHFSYLFFLGTLTLYKHNPSLIKNSKNVFDWILLLLLLIDNRQEDSNIPIPMFLDKFV